MNILYEDNHIIAVNKTNSEIVQGDKTGDISLDKLVKQYIKEKYKKTGDVFLGVTHRLDRPVSGVVLFARTSKALARLNKLFKEREIRKVYWAIVKKRPPAEAGRLEHHIVRNEKKNKSFAHDKVVKDSKKAVLTYKIIAASDHFFLLEIELETGRHHQIRAQLAKIGCPIKGDLKYGFERFDNNGGISLHSRLVEFIHPVKKEPVTIVASPPDESLWNYFANLFNH
ncbi:MAG TPA: RluA family pseudouridine synthase [Bacteroidales bacterium]|nr:RluA family pseudouridine synthase [Bacteroidales bacterium]